MPLAQALDLPESVTEIGSHLCYGCSSLTRLGLPKFAEYSCFGMLLLHLSDNPIDPRSTTAIGAHAFYGSALTSVRMPDTVTYLGKYAFAKCSVLSRSPSRHRSQS